MRRTIRTATVPSVFIAIGLVVLAGCSGGNGESSSNPDDGELVEVTVGYIPTASAAPVLYGVENGFFEEEGLKVTMESGQGGAAMLPAVVSDQYQFAFGNNLSLISAFGEGLPVYSVHAVNGTGAEPDPPEDALLVKSDSGIESPADLVGSTVAVNGLNNMPHLGAVSLLDAAGVDPSGVQFVEVGYPEMGVALSEGRVDAIVVSEPFVSQIGDDGIINFGSPYRAIGENISISSWFGSREYLEDNPEVVERFYRGVLRSNEFARENPDVMREYVPNFLNIDEDVAGEMVLAEFPEGAPTIEYFEFISNSAAEFGLIPDAVEGLEGIVYKPQS